MNFISRSGMAILLAAACYNGNAQTKELPDLTKEGLIADYRLAMQILKQQHPNPFKFIDSISYNRKVDSLLALAGKQDNVFSVMQYCPIQLVRDVHTNMAFSEDNNREMVGTINYFPFPVIIERGKILVNSKGAAIPYASEIISINRQPAQDLISSFTANSYSDGNIPTGTDRVFGSFQTMVSLRTPFAKSYEIEYVDPKLKTVKKITLNSLNPSRGMHSSRQAVMPVNLLARTYWIYGSYDDEKLNRHIDSQFI